MNFRRYFWRVRSVFNNLHNATLTSMSVLLTVQPKCTLAASHAVRWWITVCRQDRQTDGRTPDCYIVLSAIDAASVINYY